MNLTLAGKLVFGFIALGLLAVAAMPFDLLLGSNKIYPCVIQSHPDISGNRLSIYYHGKYRMVYADQDEYAIPDGEAVIVTEYLGMSGICYYRTVTLP